MVRLNQVAAAVVRALSGRWLPLKLGLAVALVVLVCHWLAVFEPIDAHFANMHFAWRGALPPDGQVAVVGISRQCTGRDHLGPWPWSRRLHADLIEKLAAAGAKAVCFDIHFADRGAQAQSRDGRGPDAVAADDLRMADAARKAGNVALAVYKRDALDPDAERDGPLIRVDSLAENAQALTQATCQGHINVPDGTIRRIPAGFVCNGRPCYQLALVGAAIALDVPPAEIRPERRGVWLGDRLVPCDRSGNLMVNYYRVPEQIHTYFVSDILSGKVSAEALRGKLVFVGQTIHGAPDADLVMTPEGVRFGVYAQATVADNILSGRLLRRLGALPFALLIALFSVAAAWRFFARGAVGKVVWSLAFAAVAVLASHVAFARFHVLVDIAPCLAVVAGNLGAALVVGMLLADREVERRDIAMATVVEAGKLSDDGPPVEIPARIAASIGRAIGVEGCCLFLPNAEALELAASHGFEDGLTAADAAAASGAVNRWVADEGRAFFADPASAPRTPRLTNDRIRSALVVPLAAHGELLGTLALYNKRPSELSPRDHFTDHDLRLVSMLTQQVAMTLERARLADELQHAIASLEAAQQKLIEAERLSAVGKVANMIIHDIKNPMQGIRMFAEMAGGTDLEPEERREFSDTMCHEIDRLVGMCQEILDFARGTSSLIREPVSLDDFLMEVLLTLAPELDNAAVKLSTDLAFGGNLALDASRVRRVVLNLFRNAIEAMAGQGGGELRVQSAPSRTGIRIQVSDTGPGIPDAIADTIFEPFVSHGKDHGTGLGLAIAKKIVEDHNGTIDVVTQTGRGTTFCIELPT